MSTLLQFSGAARKSKQRGSITIPSGSLSANATISAVTTAKTDLTKLGETNNVSATELRSALGRINLSSATTITAVREGITGDLTINWELTEFY